MRWHLFYLDGGVWYDATFAGVRVMAANTKIEWCHHTFNPWIGCSKVSPGCANCYAEEMMDKRYGRAKWGDAGTRVRTSEANWRKPLQWDKDAAAAGERHRVFCASLADVFENRPELEPWRDDLFRLITDTPNLDWLLLTKRPENVIRLSDLAIQHKGETLVPIVETVPNIWIGTSVENQEQADKRIPELLKIPAPVRFLSMEPLLGPVDLTSFTDRKCPHGTWTDRFNALDGVGGPKIDWIIVGGESGHNARPMHPDWVRSLRDQCQAADVPLFFKQWGEWVVATDWELAKRNKPWRTERPDCCWLDIDGRLEPYSSHGLSSNAYGMLRTGKHAAGRELDGQIHDAVPEVTP